MQKFAKIFKVAKFRYQKWSQTKILMVSHSDTQALQLILSYRLPWMKTILIQLKSIVVSLIA
jgi:hypothetical protein